MSSDGLVGPKLRRLGHRARLTLVATATAGILLAFVFAGVVASSRANEMRAIFDILQLAMRQAVEEVNSSPRSPDLGEISGPDPALSLAAFDPSGAVISQVGRIPLQRGLRSGKQTLDGLEVVVTSAHAGTSEVVGALPWKNHEAAIRRLAVLLAILWAPMTCCAGLATWFASRATFQPLEELAKQAEAMTEGDASSRLTLEGHDEYALFAGRLNRFLDLLESSIRRQERFVADAAHELRTPLTVIRGRIETTLRRERSEEEYRAALETALAETERLSSLVEMLLQSAAPGNEEVGELDLERAAERAHARWVDRFSQADVRLELDTEPAMATIREGEIDVVTDNLLSNALRMSPAESTCRIRVRGARLGGGVVEIEDEGPGIPPELGDRIFERFTRGDESRNRANGGFGIGLAVCRRIIVSRGGTIRAEPGAIGARFVIEVTG